MSPYLVALVLSGLVFAASILSIELGLAAAIIEIALGTIAGNFLGVQTTPWIDFLAALGSILLTFLAGTEVNTKIMRQNLKESLLIGGLSFLAPFVLFLFMWLGDAGKTHAALPVFILGLLLSNMSEHNLALQKRLRVVGFAIVTPFFFFKGGLNVGLSAIYANFGLLGAFLVIKLASKFVAVFPFARYYHDKHGTYTTLLMSTGLTFGTISSLYGLQAGIINQVQFSLLITTVILSAILPTFVAQRWFAPSIGVEGEPIWVENGNGERIHVGDGEGGRGLNESRPTE